MAVSKAVLSYKCRSRILQATFALIWLMFRLINPLFGNCLLFFFPWLKQLKVMGWCLFPNNHESYLVLHRLGEGAGARGLHPTSHWRSCYLTVGAKNHGNIADVEEKRCPIRFSCSVMCISSFMNLMNITGVFFHWGSTCSVELSTSSRCSL